MPTTPIRRVRFPDGEIEYRSIRGALAVGASIRSRGSVWRVAGYDGPTVIVEAAGTGQAGGAVVLPATPLDEPFTIEVVSEI